MSDVATDAEPADESGLLGAVDIVAAFTALRHELKLQVRAGRELTTGLETAVNACLDVGFARLADRLGRLEAALGQPPRGQAVAGGEGVRGLAAALAEIEESLERAVNAVTEQAGAWEREATEGPDGDEAEADADDEPAAAFADAWDACVGRTPWLVRRLAAGLIARLRSLSDEALERAGDDRARTADSVRGSLAAAATALADAGQGLELLLVRTRRLMDQAGLERLDVLLEPFDADRMRAVDVVADDTVPAGHVAEQYRPGYLLHGAVLRPAEVGVSR